MNYIGSKFKLCDFIYHNITESIKKPLNECVFCDLFAGSGVVSAFFKDKVKKVIANDSEFYSFILCQKILNSLDETKLQNYVKTLNETPFVRGKIYEHYSLGGTKDKAFQRLYFSDENAMKIDAIRQKIELLKEQKALNLQEYYFLLALLLKASDKVANTASVYGAFLKKLKNSALKPLKLECKNLQEKQKAQKNKNEIFNENANELIDKIKGDILYLDPPYNHRQYGANYHLLNTIALYDDFTPQGKTGLRAYERSNWCKKDKVFNELEMLIKRANFRWIFLSYNDEGILSLKQIEHLFKKYGKYEVKSKIYQRFKADCNRVQKQDYTREYLHILEKN